MPEIALSKQMSKALVSDSESDAEIIIPKPKSKPRKKIVPKESGVGSDSDVEIVGPKPKVSASVSDPDLEPEAFPERNDLSPSSRKHVLIRHFPICMKHIEEIFGEPTVIGSKVSMSNVEWRIMYKETEFVLCDGYTYGLDPEQTMLMDRNLYVRAIPESDIHKKIELLLKAIRKMKKACSKCRTYRIEYDIRDAFEKMGVV